MGEAADYNSRWGDDENKQFLEEAQLRWNPLHMGAHPSGYGIGQMHNVALSLMTYHPEFDKHHRERARSHGIFVQTLLLRKTKGPPDFPEGKHTPVRS